MKIRSLAPALAAALLTASLAACATDQEKVVLVPTASALEQCKAALLNAEPPQTTIPLCQRAASTPGIDPAAHLYLGQALLSGGLRPEAKAEYALYISLTGAPDAAVTLAKLQIEDGELTQAQVLVEHTLSHNPSYVEAHELLGEIGRLRHDCRLALAGYDGALRLSPGYGPAMEGKALLLRTVGCAAPAAPVIKGGPTLQGGAKALRPDQW